MKDSTGTTLRIGDIVTLNRQARPRYMVGQFAQVVGYGEIRVKLAPIEGDFQSIRKEMRLEPQQVTIGKIMVPTPFTHDPRFQESMTLIRIIYRNLLDIGVHEEIISPQQMNNLLFMYDHDRAVYREHEEE